MVAKVRGTIVRFSHEKGYGFIYPDDGGEDVYLSRAALDGADLAALRPGAIVEYEPIRGEQGMRALVAWVVPDGGGPTGPRLAPAPRAAVPASRVAVATRSEASARSDDDPDGDLCEIVSAAELAHEVTDVLITTAPGLTGAEMAAIRERLVGYARARGWLED